MSAARGELWRWLLTVGLVIAAAAVTGSTEVYFFLYLGLMVVGMAYLLARPGLTSLEAGASLDRTHATVGDTASLAKTLEAIMTGSSPDDAAALRKALQEQDKEPAAKQASSDALPARLPLDGGGDRDRRTEEVLWRS